MKLRFKKFYAVLYIFIFRLVDNKMENEIFKRILTGIPWFHFAPSLFLNEILVHVIYKYLECSAVSKNVLHIFVEILPCILLKRYEGIVNFLIIYFYPNPLTTY
jgi:hypothetical protein